EIRRPPHGMHQARRRSVGWSTRQRWPPNAASVPPPNRRPGNTPTALPEQIGLDIQPGVAHLRQLVAQGARADAQTLGGFLATAALGAQGVEDQLELPATQVLAE